VREKARREKKGGITGLSRTTPHQGTTVRETKSREENLKSVERGPETKEKNNRKEKATMVCISIIARVAGKKETTTRTRGKPPAGMGITGKTHVNNQENNNNRVKKEDGSWSPKEGNHLGGKDGLQKKKYEQVEKKREKTLQLPKERPSNQLVDKQSKSANDGDRTKKNSKTAQTRAGDGAHPGGTPLGGREM